MAANYTFKTLQITIGITEKQGYSEDPSLIKNLLTKAIYEESRARYEDYRMISLNLSQVIEYYVRNRFHREFDYMYKREIYGRYDENEIIQLSAYREEQGSLFILVLVTLVCSAEKYDLIEKAVDQLFQDISDYFASILPDNTFKVTHNLTSNTLVASATLNTSISNPSPPVANTNNSENKPRRLPTLFITIIIGAVVQYLIYHEIKQDGLDSLKDELLNDKKLELMLEQKVRQVVTDKMMESLYKKPSDSKGNTKKSLEDVSTTKNSLPR